MVNLNFDYRGVNTKVAISAVIIIVIVAAAAAWYVLATRGEEKPEEPVVVGVLGAMNTDFGKAVKRAVEIGIDEYNEDGGILGGRPLELVTADTKMDVHEGGKAYEYLASRERVDLIVAGCIDDVTLGFLPRLAEYKTPTLSTWTTAIRAIDTVRKNPEKYKSYFMMNPNDWHYGDSLTRYIQDIFVEKMGWENCVVLNEDTSFGNGTAGFVIDVAAPRAGLEIIDQIKYDIKTEDYSPIFDKLEASGADFVFQITAANPIPITAQYVEKEVSIPMAGANASAMVPEFWEDVGGLGAGISCHCPGPVFPGKFDPQTQRFNEKWKERYDTRPTEPYFNAYHGYWGLKTMVKSAERAGGFKPLDDWVKEMEEVKLILRKNNERWFVINYYEPGEIDPLTDETFPHSAVYDPVGVDGELKGVTGSAIQWYGDGTAKCIWPPKYATGEFTLPPWLKS